MSGRHTKAPRYREGDNNNQRFGVCFRRDVDWHQTMWVPPSIFSGDVLRRSENA